VIYQSRNIAADVAEPGAEEVPSKYDLRREEVIDAAAAVFSELGYHGASTKLIADRVGIKQGSLYYYFTSKEAALEEVCTKAVGDLIEGLIAVIEMDLPVEEKLVAAVFNHVKRLVERGDYVRTFISQRFLLPDESRKSVGKKARKYEQLITDLIEVGVQNGRFDPGLDCELAALRFISECNGVFVWYGKRVKDRTIDEIGAGIASQLLNGFLRRP